MAFRAFVRRFHTPKTRSGHSRGWVREQVDAAMPDRAVEVGPYAVGWRARAGRVAASMLIGVKRQVRGWRGRERIDSGCRGRHFVAEIHLKTLETPK